MIEFLIGMLNKYIKTQPLTEPEMKVILGFINWLNKQDEVHQLSNNEIQSDQN